MNAELIPIREHEGKQTVSGRELHKFLDLGRDYTTWFKKMVEYGFTAGVDYLPISGEVAREGRGTVSRTDHALTLDMAKHIGMVQRTERGRQIRDYFIEVEKRARSVAAPDLATPQGVLEMAQLFAKTAGELVEAKNEIAVLVPRAAMADAFEQDHGMKLRPFVQKYFPDEKESAILDFLYHVKRFLIHDPQGRWSDVQKKRIPGPTHQHPRVHGREFFRLAEEEDRNGKIRLKLRVRRDREHHLVGYLARHGFKTTHDALPVFDLGEVV